MKRFPEKIGAKRCGCLFLVTVALVAGCRKQEIRVYRVPKEKEPELAEAQERESLPPQIQWKTPAGWEEQTPSGMGLASFLVSGDGGRRAQLSVMTFPGEGAGELSLVNIVRENAGLAPISDEELARLVERVEVGAAAAKLVDLSGAGNSSSNTPSNRILVAVFPHGGVTWFFKFAGDASVVSAQKPALLAFLKSVSFPEAAAPSSRPSRFVSTNVKRVPSGQSSGVEAADDSSAKPTWDVPAVWQETPAGQPLLARFEISGSEGKAEVTVSAFPGAAGGLLANMNRWRGQIGLKAVSQAEAEKLVTSLDVMGGKAMLMDMNGQNPGTGQKVRLITAIVPREGQTWFYKLMGDPAVAEREKAAFVKFVQSVRYPNA